MGKADFTEEELRVQWLAEYKRQAKKLREQWRKGKRVRSIFDTVNINLRNYGDD